jgi:hypothetical protein
MQISRVKVCTRKYAFAGVLPDLLGPSCSLLLWDSLVTVRPQGVYSDMFFHRCQYVPCIFFSTLVVRIRTVSYCMSRPI